MASQPRTICIFLKNNERRSRNISSPCSSLPLKRIEPIWRQASEMSETWSAMPSQPVKPPFSGTAEDQIGLIGRKGGRRQPNKPRKQQEKYAFRPHVTRVYGVEWHQLSPLKGECHVGVPPVSGKVTLRWLPFNAM